MVGEMVPFKSENDCPERLTCIHTRIHCAATQDTTETNGHDELERIDIDNFLSTLAQVATAIARREQQLNDNESRSIHPGQ